MTVCEWFDSLWTLQDVCLRPDMWLCNQDWELLTVGVQRVPVAINALIALTNECAQYHHRHMATFKIDDFPGHSFKPSFDPTTNETPADGMFGGLLSYGVFHPGFLELFELFERSGLEQLWFIQPKNILDLDSWRFCKSRRAEAIMSVLGIKNWYQALKNAPEPAEGNLVLGQYPIEFIQEVATSLGAAFTILYVAPTSSCTIVQHQRNGNL
ncbi:HET domain-containing protein [Fusarium keratoplasticum]|nr:HET domain-containing protein [Fusarium keratoplasticum]